MTGRRCRRRCASTSRSRRSSRRISTTRYATWPISQNALGPQLPHGLDAGLELFARRGRDRRAAADAAQLLVDPAVRLTGPVMGDRDERVELAAQLAQLAV